MWESQEDYIDTDECPAHGKQVVSRWYSSGGPDPYNVNVLECGDHVMCFGPELDGSLVNVIVRTKHD